jgi:hypothetical protein
MRALQHAQTQGAGPRRGQQVLGNKEDISRISCGFAYLLV